VEDAYIHPAPVISRSPEDAETLAESSDDAPQAEAEVVSLDSFRK